MMVLTVPGTLSEDTLKLAVTTPEPLEVKWMLWGGTTKHCGYRCDSLQYVREKMNR